MLFFHSWGWGPRWPEYWVSWLWLTLPLYLLPGSFSSCNLCRTSSCFWSWSIRSFSCPRRRAISSWQLSDAYTRTNRVYCEVFVHSYSFFHTDMKHSGNAKSEQMEALMLSPEKYLNIWKCRHTVWINMDQNSLFYILNCLNIQQWLLNLHKSFHDTHIETHVTIYRNYHTLRYKHKRLLWSWFAKV